MKPIFFTSAVLLLVAGCSDGGPSPTGPAPIQPSPADVQLASTALPKSDEIARIYSRSCRNCHSVAGTGAPLTHHEAAWQPRLEARGRDGLLASTKYGYRFMPAMGLCASCSDEQFMALIDFMIAPE